MAAALENNGENNRGNGSRNCCCHVHAVALATFGVGMVMLREASGAFTSKVVKFLECLALKCQNTRSTL